MHALSLPGSHEDRASEGIGAGAAGATYSGPKSPGEVDAFPGDREEGGFDLEGSPAATRIV